MKTCVWSRNSNATLGYERFFSNNQGNQKHLWYSIWCRQPERFCKISSVLSYWGPDEMAAICRQIYPIHFLISYLIQLISENQCLDWNFTQICIFFNENIWISNKFHWSLFWRVQLTISQHWVQVMAWRRTDDKPLDKLLSTQLNDAYMRHPASTS